ncbi:hypothetical protein J5N97_022677 [Dioscorea zingiberensis]|uniref:Retrotransposon gag domain-containing protein n=1 Tax=Dioscorea zingiberensis TaxID=325984 RepID=A0A9D5CBN6_9LILI|nr:hypothetical protein J5N97_022677 [Dioscorea zingiberensis]
MTSLPNRSITTWPQLAEKFLVKYFPPAKITKLRSDISSFIQFEMETLYDTWERYKYMPRKCPQHVIEDWMQVQTFYNELNIGTKQILDAAAGGSLCSKNPQVAKELVDEMATNVYQYCSEKTKPSKVAGIQYVDAITALTATVEALSKKINNIGIQQQTPLFMCIGYGSKLEEGKAEQIEKVDFMGRAQNNPYSLTYNPRWKNHPNLAYSTPAQKRTNPPLGYQPPTQEKKRASLESLNAQYIQMNEERAVRHEEIMSNYQASLQNLELQVTQIAKILAERQSSTLPSNIKVNPRESVKAITLKSGTELALPPAKETEETPSTPYKEVGSESAKRTVTSDKKEVPMVLEYKLKIPYPAMLKKDQ